MSTAERFRPPTVAQRGQLVQAIAAAQQHKPKVGEKDVRLDCPRCGAGLFVNIQSSGLSRGNCHGNCGIRWSQ